MKKAFESWKIWTILSAFIFMMTCGLVVLAANWVPSGSTNLDWFDQFRSTSLNANWMEWVLTAEHWDDIMSGLDSMIIPKWAIMAFTGECPRGWTHFSQADDRYLRWTAGSVMNKSWAAERTLTIENIPPHSHYYKDTVFSEKSNQDDWSFMKSPYKDRFFYDTLWIVVWGGYKYDIMIWNYGGFDYDNTPIAWIRGTSSEVCRLYNADGTKIYDSWRIDWHFQDLNRAKENLKSVCNQSTTAFSVLDPYITVNYCVKL